MKEAMVLRLSLGRTRENREVVADIRVNGKSATVSCTEYNVFQDVVAVHRSVPEYMGKLYGEAFNLAMDLFRNRGNINRMDRRNRARLVSMLTR